MSRQYPTLEQDVLTLLGPDAPVYDHVQPSVSDIVARLKNSSNTPRSRQDMVDLHHSLLTRYDGDVAGALMRDTVLDRDRQFLLLEQAGPDMILEIMAQGNLLPQVATLLRVSHSILSEYIHTCRSAQEIAKAESLGVDMMVSRAHVALATATTKEQIAQAKAQADHIMKLAKARSKKWVEQKTPDVAASDAKHHNPSDVNEDSSDTEIVHGFRLVLRPEEELAPEKPVPQVTKMATVDEDTILENGTFRLVNDLTPATPETEDG